MSGDRLPPGADAPDRAPIPPPAEPETEPDTESALDPVDVPEPTFLTGPAAAADTEDPESEDPGRADPEPEDPPTQELIDTVLPGAPTDEPSQPIPLAMAAICHRCGGGKKGPFVPCKACGYTPAGMERQIAWLFSEHHLESAELAEGALRIRSGDRPDPPRSLIEQARVKMGAAPLTTDARRPLTRAQLALMTAGNIVLTPLTGLAIWWGLKLERPVAAHQALVLTVPVLLLTGVLWVVMIGRWTLL